jgi:signal peptidase I
MSTELKPVATPPAKPQDDSIKETFESIVIAFILAFVFRAYVVEAFVIPTGSMAPTLLGEHLRVTCDKCGYHFKVDTPGGRGSNIPISGRQIMVDLPYHCPMCQFENTAGKGTYISSGDRILVHKYLYSINEPKRFDVVVFKAPHLPQTNYIKRLVGLPKQDLMVLEGNVYYNPTSGNDAGWRIARKTDPNENPHAEKIQRAVWQPIYYSQYLPLDYDPTGTGNRWRIPWVVAHDAGTDAAAWRRGNGAGDPELDPRGGYVFESDGRGALRFAFDRVYTPQSAGFFAYGQKKGSPIIPVEDVRLAVAIAPRKAGAGVTLRTTARLDDKAGVTHAISASIDAQGNATLHRSDQTQPLATANVGPLTAGATRVVELWYVDQEASLWVDGDRVLVKQFDDINYADLLNRALPYTKFENAALAAEHKATVDDHRRIELHVPVVKIEVTGAPVTLHRVEMDRDLFYTSSGKGAVSKDRDGGSPWGEPARLKADEFFCLGDNSPFSADSRAWDSVDPWVLKRSFAEGATDEDSHGIVPRRLMMGKAFFVYFPTMIGSSSLPAPWFPNFGEMRFIH